MIAQRVRGGINWVHLELALLNHRILVWWASEKAMFFP
jgi:hypothetical protein